MTMLDCYPNKSLRSYYRIVPIHDLTKFITHILDSSSITVKSEVISNNPFYLQY